MATSISPSNNCNIVAEPLRKDNFENWKACMENYLLSQDLWEVVEDEKPSEPPNAKEDEEVCKAWKRKNAAALHAIQISCSPELLAQIRTKKSARDAWLTLANLCKPKPALSLPAPPPPPLPPPPPPRWRWPALGVWQVERTALVKAICGGDLNTVRKLLTEHPNLMNAHILKEDSPFAIHFAILSKLEIVDEFLRNATNEDLEKTCRTGDTALHLAAVHKGKTKIADQLILKNNKLLTIQNKEYEIPFILACKLGHHEDMIHYLYSMTPPEFLLSSRNKHQANLAISYCIINKRFDVALDLLRRCPQLAVYESNRNAISDLSCQTSAFPSTSGLSFWQRCVYSCFKVKIPEASFDEIRLYTSEQDQMATKSFTLKGRLLGLWSIVLTFFGIKQIYDLKLKHLYAHELLALASKTIADSDVSQIRSKVVGAAIFQAARLGITEFVIQMIKANMDLLWANDSNGNNIFQCAVANRQDKTFSLIYGLDILKTEFIAYVNKEGNSILHLAGQLSNYSQLAKISGGALQMQRELQWFKEVESIVPITYKAFVNSSGKTAAELFHESHEKMIEEGEKWMKDIAQSSTIVGTLIITIMFATLFTVPGGISQDTGIPLFLSKKAFKVFIISDAISLSSSSASVLTSVGILTSRYEANDFLKSLPKRLIIALFTLFISIATMMIAFCSAAFIMLDGQLEIAIPIFVLSAIPVFLFIWLEFPLLAKMIISTYGPGIFDRNMKNWLI